jgi:tetrahydromethanopterin S-methyltransferase subunit G
VADRPYADEGEVIATFDAIRKQLDRIEEQVVKTNGRVRSLELWRSFSMGAIAVMSLILTILVTVLVRFVY